MKLMGGIATSNTNCICAVVLLTIAHFYSFLIFLEGWFYFIDMLCYY